MSADAAPRRLEGPFPDDAAALTGEWLPRALGLPDPGNHPVEVGRIGEGRGHMASAFRVRFLSPHPDHPAPSFVVKLAAQAGPARRTAEQGGLYEREVQFFLDIAHRSPVRVPRCFAAGYAEDGSFALVLEDLGAATEIDQVTGLDRDTARRILEQLADFHARWWDADSLTTMDWASRHTDGHRVDNLTRILTTGWPRLISALGLRLPDRCAEVGAEMAATLPAAFGALTDEPDTLLHGDMRLDNLLFEGTDRPVAILDWQSLSRGSAAIDVAYFLAQNVPAEVLLRHGDELLEGYGRRLRGHGVDMPSERLRRAIVLAVPLTFAVASSLFVVSDGAEVRTRELAYVMATGGLAAVDLFGHPRDLLAGAHQ